MSITISNNGTNMSFSKKDFVHTQFLPRLPWSWHNRTHRIAGTSWMYDLTRLWENRVYTSDASQEKLRTRISSPGEGSD